MLNPGLSERESKRRQIATLPTQDDLPYEDDDNMETERHKKQMELLISSLQPWLDQHQAGYVNGNMFVYYSAKQIRHQDFKGPDVFVVTGVSNIERKSWVVWQEGKGPDVVIELLSETTADYDQGEKKKVYQNQLKVPEYFWFDPFSPHHWAGFRLSGGVYRKLKPQQGRLISRSLGLALIHWRGVFQNIDTTWLRWATLTGELLLLPEEAEKKRADLEKKRADLEQKRADLAEQQIQTEAQRVITAEQRALVAEQRAQAEAKSRLAAETEIARLTTLLAQSQK